MTQEIKTKLQLFTSNFDTLKKNFKWEQAPTVVLSAILISNEHEVVNIEKIQYCKDLIKRSTPLFSVFRGNVRFTFASILSICDDANKMLTNTLTVFDLMRREKFRQTDYLAIAAINIARQCEPNEYPYIVGRTRQFYDAMREHHRFVTSDDDYCFAAMLALTDLNVNSSIVEIEAMFQRLKPTLSSANGLQSLTHVLAISPQPMEIKVQRTVEIYQRFKKASYNFNDTATMSSLGVISLLSDDDQKIVDEVVEVSEELNKIRGLGGFSYTKKQRGILAFSLVAGVYADSLSNTVISTTLTNSITNILIAQETAMIVAATAATTAAVNASN